MAQNFFNYIIPECYVDTNLIETLLRAQGCNHQKGCNQVCKVMKEKFVDRFAIGIIDADKRQPSDIAEFNKIGERGHLQVLKHPARPHFIILISPAIDQFILDSALELNIDLSDFNLSADLQSFTRQTKNILSNKDKRFRSLFAALESATEISILKNLLSYLKSSQYSSTPDDILQILEYK